jgi:hypothetical protein
MLHGQLCCDSVLLMARSAASGCKAVEQTHSVLLSCKHSLTLHAVAVLNMRVVCVARIQTSVCCMCSGL